MQDCDSPAPIGTEGIKKCHAKDVKIGEDRATVTNRIHHGYDERNIEEERAYK
jgi:hypothetical protein